MNQAKVPATDDRQVAGSGAVAKVTITSIQQQVLEGLINVGGACSYRQLFRVCYGLRWEDMPGVERSRLGVSVRGLEKKGLVEITRRWGTWGYGQPETVTITETGRGLAQAN
jgi:hypothetical protein